MAESHELITTREIDAPVARVWAAWRDPAKVAKWWGPAGFHSEVRELDLRAGGRLDLIMYGPDGTDYPNVYIFDDVVTDERLVFTNIGSERYGLAAFQSVFTTEPIDDKTRVVLTARFASAEEKRKHVEDFGAIKGSQELLERLETQSK